MSAPPDMLPFTVVVGSPSQGSEPALVAGKRTLRVDSGGSLGNRGPRAWHRSASGRSVLLLDGRLLDTTAADLAERLERRGTEALSAVRGSFAVVFLDLATGRVLLVRDRLGERALYRARLPDGRWVIGTSVRGVSAVAPKSFEIDPRGVECFLRMGAVGEPLTLLRGVRAVMPGSWESIEPDDATRSGRWWSLEAPPVDGEEAASNEEIHRALAESVELRTASLTEVGVLSSGGSDSTGLLSLLHELRAPRVHTVALGFGGPDGDLSEHVYQRAAAASFETAHHEWLAGAEEVEGALDDFFDAMDQPIIDGLNTFLATRIAARAGVRVVLSGFGGDELFAGYGVFRSLDRAVIAMRILGVLPGRLRRMLARPFVRSPPREYERPEVAKVACAVGEVSSLAGYYALRRSLFLPGQVRRLMGACTFRLEGALSARPRAGPDAVARWSALEITNHLPNMLLRACDTFARANGVEILLPYLDHRVVERVLRVPAERKVARAHRKPLMRDVFGGVLPSFVWAERKRHFHVPLERWHTRTAFQRLDVPGLDPEEVDHVIAAYRERPGPRTYSRVWSLHVLARALRPGGRPQPPGGARREA